MLVSCPKFVFKSIGTLNGFKTYSDQFYQCESLFGKIVQNRLLEFRVMILVCCH